MNDRVTNQERQDIQQMSIAEGLSGREIARRTHRDRATISTILTAEDTVALRTHLEGVGAEDARSYLRRQVTRAAKDWITASRAGAERGDHRPARDLLLHTKTIEPVEEVRGGGSRVAIVIGMPGRPVAGGSALVITGPGDDTSIT